MTRVGFNGSGHMARGIELLDAPVVGQTIGAEAGRLAIYAGGEATAFTRALPVLALSALPATRPRR